MHGVVHREEQGGERLDAAAEIGLEWGALYARVLQMTIDARRGAPPSGVALLGEGQERIMQNLDLLEPKCRGEALFLRPVSQFDPQGHVQARNVASARRGARLATVAAVRARLNNPFFFSENPHARVGPVFGPAILLDRSCVVLPGAPTSQGADTAWVFTRPDIVRHAYDVWDDTRAAATPPDGTWPRFNDRQLEITRRRGLGWTNSRIARDLGISARTVTNKLGLIATHWREFIA